MIIDASGLILGRMASFVAKNLLNGKKVAIINCEKAVISGEKHAILQRYFKRRGRKTMSNPRRGPFFYTMPDRIVWRTIRGMIPWDKKKGRDAMKRLKVFIGVPKELKNAKPIDLPEKYKCTKLMCDYLTVEELSKELRGGFI